MKMNQKQKLITVVIAVFVFTCIWKVSLPEVNHFSVPHAISGIQTASANAHYGILGQAAPALKLITWIDGNGKKIAPIRLTDYRGKVVYLYFFQDW